MTDPIFLLFPVMLCTNLETIPIVWVEYNVCNYFKLEKSRLLMLDKELCSRLFRSASHYTHISIFLTNSCPSLTTSQFPEMHEHVYKHISFYLLHYFPLSSSSISHCWIGTNTLQFFAGNKPFYR